MMDFIKNIAVGLLTIGVILGLFALVVWIIISLGWYMLLVIAVFVCLVLAYNIGKDIREKWDDFEVVEVASTQKDEI
jgi:hypothetical protein